MSRHVPHKLRGLSSRMAALERLEDRRLLVSDLVLSEFLADNKHTLADEDGQYSDWIEIHNTSTAAVNLANWSLTDDASNLGKWKFPSQTLPAGGYLVVFASGKDRTVANAPLHTNFQLDADGEYLALVQPGGTTIATQFSPAYPPQKSDIAYGTAQQTLVTNLIATGATAKIRVPTTGALGSTWTGAAANEPFNDSAAAGWTAGPTGVGYDTEPGTGAGGGGQIIGPATVDRPNVDGAVGSIFILDTDPFTQSGIVTQWSMFSDTPFAPARMVTPLIFHRSGDTFTLTGVGQTRTSDQSGLQNFPFALQSGSAQVGADGYYLGFKDGGNTSQNGGVIEFSDGTDDQVRWFGGGHSGDLVPNQPFSNGQLFSRSYSIQATTAPTLADQVATNLQAAMRGVNPSVYLRVPFQVSAPIGFDALTLRMKYDDGFVAYLNGVEVARRNAPAAVAFNSAAPVDRPKNDAVSFESIDVSSRLNLLHVGTNVLAIQGLNDTISSPEFLILPELSASKVLASAGRYLLQPTPGAANGDGVIGFVADTTFSVDRGFYSTPISVGINTATVGASIYYTTNGSLPGPTNPTATLYTGAFTLSTTTTLRAAAFKQDYQATTADTQTYVFPASVANQGASPPGLPSTWGGRAADYEVDPDVVQTTLPGYGLTDALLSIPTVSITLDPNDLFSPGQGIYSNSLQRGSSWEKEASIELINPNGTPGFQLDAGVRVTGSSSRDLNFTPKLSFRLLFKNQYDGDLNFPLFDNYAVDKFSQLILKASSTDSWPVVDGWFVDGVQRWNNDRATYQRNAWMRDTQIAMGEPGAHGKYVNLYLNGLFWGQYDLLERPNADFNANQFGGNDSEYDVIKDFGEVQSGSKDAWNQMMALAAAGLSSDAAFQRIQGNNPDGTRNPAFPVYLDVQNLIDYMILHIYAGAEDWPNHNWWAARRTGPESEGFRFFVWDQEITNDSLARVTTLSEGRFEQVATYDTPAYLYARLRENPTFQWQFIDSVHKQLFNGGALTQAANDVRWMGLASQIDKSIVGESARWGDAQVTTPFKRETNWLAEQNWSHNTYWPQIPAIALQRFRSVGLYPNVEAPTLSKFGGQIAPGFQLTLSAPAGTIYYRLDGLDPRLPDGSLRPQTLIYSSPITLSANTHFKARAQSGGNWSALDDTTFSINPAAAAGNLAISEINYNPPAPSAAELAINSAFQNDDFEFIELLNIGAQAINLSGVHFSQGIDFTFPESLLAIGQRIVVVKNLAAFQARYGAGVAVAGQFAAGSGLSNNGETLTLLGATNTAIQSFTYADSSSWPQRADGRGSSLEAISGSSDYSNGASWRASTEYFGTPGAAGVGPLHSVVINELLTHSTLPLVDTIELLNTTASSIDISGWYLSDGSNNYLKYRLPAGTILAAGGYLVLNESQFNPVPAGASNFSLDGAHGESLSLVTANATRPLLFVDQVDFPAAADGESFGRWPNATGALYPMSSRTLGIANSGPRIGPVIISELMYHPASGNDDLEFVELHNITAASVDLGGWKFDQGIDYTFPAGTTIGAGQNLVVLHYNPQDAANATRLSTFRTTYGISASVPVIGGYTGVLNDNGEALRLVRPDTPPVDEPAFTPFVLVDEVQYAVGSPWPTSPAGTGPSLSRINQHVYGDDPTNWIGDTASPGKLYAYVADRRVFYNHSRFDGNDIAAGTSDGAAIATDKQALRPGQTAKFSNYTSYNLGINGVMIDVYSLTGTPVAADFTFRMGNDDNPAAWATAPAPVIDVRRGGGVAQSDRVTLIWPDGAIRNKWLQVTVKNSANTGLTSADVFYFGNAIGETGNQLGNSDVTAADEVYARSNPRSFLNPADVTNASDFNRDGLVNATDQILARTNPTSIDNHLILLHAPSSLSNFAAAFPSATLGLQSARGSDSDTLAALAWAVTPVSLATSYDQPQSPLVAVAALSAKTAAVGTVDTASPTSVAVPAFDATPNAIRLTHLVAIDEALLELIATDEIPAESLTRSSVSCG